jgi:hypothetical protein
MTDFYILIEKMISYVLHKRFLTDMVSALTLIKVSVVLLKTMAFDVQSLSSVV